MKKLIAAAVLGAVALPFGGVSAAEPNCVVLGEGDAPAHECTYEATGAGNYVAVTPNGWRIYVLRDTDGNPVTPPEEVNLAVGDAGSLASVSTGALASVAGETVHVWIDRDCVPFSEFPCGNVGLVFAGSA